MGIFDFFSKKKKANLTDTQLSQHAIKDRWNEPAENAPQFDADYLLEKIEVVPGLVLPRAFANHWPELSQTKANFIKIHAVPTEDALSLEQSKFGSYPMLPKNVEYPRDQFGEYMFPLAQINFRELPPFPGYPRSGYLQFYIATDEAHGLRFDNYPNDFKVLFFEEQDVENHHTDFSFLKNVMESDLQPVHKPHALSFEIKEEYFGLGNVVNNMNAGPTLQQIAASWHDEELEDELMEYMYDFHSHNGHKLGGYAYFTQEDPRKYKESDKKDFVLLFQLDSDVAIMWGDMGVANFFIRPDDLAKKDFSNIMYSWDCS